MKRFGRRRKVVLLGTALALLGLAVAAASAIGDSVTSGNLEISIEGKVTPTKLPKNEPAPISLNVSGTIGTTDGSHVPALKTIALNSTRTGRSTPKDCRPVTPRSCSRR